MSEVNQKKLYEHYKKVEKDGITDIIRANAKKHKEDILKSFPKFKVEPKEKVEPQETKPKSEKEE